AARLARRCVRVPRAYRRSQWLRPARAAPVPEIGAQRSALQADHGDGMRSLEEGLVMKGPRGRSKHEVRRLWECPVCRRREYTSGQVVNRLCECLATQQPPKRTWMRLLEDGPEPSPSRRGDPSLPSAAEDSAIP